MTEWKPLLYDVYSGAGGAAVGYSRAGFRVIGKYLMLEVLARYNSPQVRRRGDL